jgi:hypothetical protein
MSLSSRCLDVHDGARVHQSIAFAIQFVVTNSYVGQAILATQFDGFEKGECGFEILGHIPID